MSLNSNIESIEIVRSTDLEQNEVNKENVQVKSSMIHDSSNKVSLNIGSEKLDQLLARLSTTHAQLDYYTQRRTQQISIETQNIIEKILQETKEKQRELLVEAQIRAQQLQQQYQEDLQIKVNLLNEDKAQQLADLEKCLNIQQENILINARQQIDLLQREANLVCLVLSFSFSSSSLSVNSIFSTKPNELKTIVSNKSPIKLFQLVSKIQRIV